MDRVISSGEGGREDRDPSLGRKLLCVAVILVLVASLPAGSALAGVAPSHGSRASGAGIERPSVPRMHHASAGGSGTPPQTAPEVVNPLSGYSSEPAPMGIADFGVGASGAYQYSTNSSLGSVYIASLSTRNSTGGTLMSFQLNVNLHFTANGKAYVYWIQDVAILDTQSNFVYFQNNVWNSSLAKATMVASGISGNGTVRQSSSAGYYATVAKSSAPGNGVDLAYPSQMDFRVNSTLSASRQPQVSFEYNDGFGWVDYDTVTFTSVTRLTSLPGFVVNGFSYNPYNFDDAEMIMGGPYSGYSTSDARSDVRLQLEYWNGHNYQMVKSAYNFGADTAEGISNVKAMYYYYPSTGEIISQVAQGPGSLQKLYSQSDVGIVDVRLGLQSGVLYVRNSTAPANATQAQHPFVNGEVTLVLYPGSYLLQAYTRVGGTLYKAGTASFSGGQSVQPLLGLIGITISYVVDGGGSGYIPPSMTYVYGGQKHVVAIGASPATVLVDQGSSWSVPTSLAGSSASERWLAGTGGGVANASQSISVTYYHQFNVPASYEVVGGGSPQPPVLTYRYSGTSSSLILGASPQSAWMDAGGGYAVTDLLAGSDTMERWSPPAGGAASTTVGSASPLIISYHHQYYLAAAPTAGVSSSWYDAGATATLSAQGAYDRTSDTGQRIVSYTVDGGAPVPIAPTATTVSASVVMDSSHTFAFNSVTQYRLALGPGAQQALTAITSTPIAGDKGWYDAGTRIQASGNYVWNVETNQSRTNAIAYVLDGKGSALSREGTGAFAASFVADAPHSFDVSTVTQYRLDVVGGFGVTLSSASPTSDGFFDAGSSISASTAYSWADPQGGADRRSNLVSYSVDGTASSVPRSGSGGFATPSLTIDGPKSVEFRYVTQYRVSFTVTAASTDRKITPSSFTVETHGFGSEAVLNGSAWVDANSQVSISSLKWEGVDVRPDNFTLVVDGPQNSTVHARVYDLHLVVVDPLGLAVSGAEARIVLANGTSLASSTSADGAVSIPMVPLGTFNATVSYLGQSVKVSGDASTEPTTQAHVVLSYPVIGSAVGLLALASIALVMGRRRARARLRAR